MYAQLIAVEKKVEFLFSIICPSSYALSFNTQAIELSKRIICTLPTFGYKRLIINCLIHECRDQNLPEEM